MNTKYGHKVTGNSTQGLSPCAHDSETAYLQGVNSIFSSRLRISLLLLLLMLTLGTTTSWGQTGTDRSGIFYFVNCGSGKTGPNDPKIANITDPANYFYLVPADAPKQTNKRDAWYSSDYSSANGDSEKPYLTTYRTDKDAADIPEDVTNRPHNSVWIVKFASTDSSKDYYYLIHAATGKYVVYEPPFSAKKNRKSVHLLTTDSPGENAKFAITIHSDHYNFRPKSVSSGNQYFNASNRNFNYYYSHSSTTDGDVDYYEGLIGLWKDAGDASDWKPEATLLDAPAISNPDANNIVTVTDVNGLPDGYNIHYTTDGSTPTASSPVMESGRFTVTSSLTLKAVVERYGIVLTKVASANLDPAPCAIPVITFDDTTSKVSITCATLETTIYYTTDGTDPTISSTLLYSAPFSVSGPTTVKAIATHATIATSSVAELVIAQVATPTIQNNGSNAISITSATPGATIYYTTDGSDPTTSSTKYTSPLTDNVSNVTIKAIAVKENMITSAVGSGKVTLQCATPVITRDGMTFTLSCRMPTDATLYYTIGDGSETQYNNSPVTFTSDQLPVTVTAVARHSDYTDSDNATFELLNGTGTSSDPYLIYGATDFANFISNVNAGTTSSACYKLEVDVSGSGVNAITTAFSGTFDGGLHTISNLGHALFNTVNGGTVKNVILDNVSISGGTTFTVDATEKVATGAIANVAKGAARIYNCGVLATSSTVKTNDDGYTEITSCSSSVGGTADYVGGLVGFLDEEARVINCYSYANITGGTEVGGIVGHNNVATTSNNLKTMVMNCMYYGDITAEGANKAPIYNGTNIENKDSKGVGNYNYFYSEAPYAKKLDIQTPNCALMAEKRFLQRFEFFRHLLNSHRELAAWWATGDSNNKDQMMKWVLEPSQIGTSTCYPILKTPGYYPSVVNIDAEHATPQTERNKGGKQGTLTVNIQMGSGGVVYGPPAGATITTSSLSLNILDKDPDHFNFNYYKVQLPYYNDVGTKNYTGNRVVTGWKIVSISGGTPGSFTTGDDATTNASGEITSAPYNFADRNCTNKDLYGVSGRVFNQGAYWDVPYGVTAITIEPYWAKCTYLADQNADKVYNQEMTTGYDVPNVGGGQIYTNRNSYSIAGENQVVFTSKGDAIATSNSGLFQGVSASSHTVYDYAVVLVGNYHFYGSLDADKNKPYTVTSIDLDGDNEPDYSYILRFDSRKGVHPVRVDFINIPGLGMAQKSISGTGSYNFGIMQPNGFFESTNTSLFRVTQFEYDAGRDVTMPYIVQGGVFEQWVGSQAEHKNKITYFHVGGNVWFKEFHRGTHQDKTWTTKHPPVSVTGGDYDEFYLTGLYRGDVTSKEDNAECYINGGRFGTVCGAAMEGIGKANGADNTGNITWLIQNADIKEFYAGGLNAASGHTVTGNLSTTITGGYIGIYCGGPKFGDMSSGKTVTTTATGCTFDTFFGAGYGGNSYSRLAPRNHNNIVNFPHNDAEGAGNHASWNAWVTEKYTQSYDASYGGVSTQFNYQFLPMSSNVDNVARIFVEYVKFSLATTRKVTTTLTGCTINKSFYGGGSLGKVAGDVSSTLTNCTVKGNVFGAGYSAELPPVEVDSIGFRVEPYYYTDFGTYRTAQKGVTTTYTWQHRDETIDASHADRAIDKTNHILYTNENIDKSDLGSVQGNVILTIQTEAGKTTTIGTAGNPNTGNVFGGGEQSYVTNSTDPVTIHNVTVNLKGPGTTNILGNVFGGGDQGEVQGSAKVNIMVPDPPVTP